MPLLILWDNSPKGPLAVKILSLIFTVVFSGTSIVFVISSSEFEIIAKGKL